MKAAVPKVLLLIDELESITAGGTERQILQIAQLLGQSNFRTAIATLRGSAWLTPEIAECPVYHADVRSFWSRHSLMELRKLSIWMRQQKFHVVTTFFSESNCFGAWLARWSGTPILIGARRNMGTSEPPQWRLFQQLSNRSVDRFHANCEAVRQKVIQIENISPDRIDVVYNGIDLARFKDIGHHRPIIRKQFSFPHNAIVYGMVSGLRPEKGIGDFLEAAQKTIQALPLTRILIVGDGPERSALQTFVDANKMHSYISFAGGQRDVRPYLAAMDIGVLSSYGEGLSNSLLEYMAAGLPVIATNVGGNKEAAGYAGVLVPANDPDALAAAMQQMQDNVLRRMLSKRAFAQARCFSLEQARYRLSSIYSDLLCKKLPLEFSNHEGIEHSLHPGREHRALHEHPKDTETSEFVGAQKMSSTIYSTTNNSQMNRSSKLA